MFIWKPRKSWGRLLSLQDLEPDQPEQRKGKTITQRGCRSKRTLFFVGNIEPLLLAGADYGRYVARSGAGDCDGGEEDHAGGGAGYRCCVRYWYRGLVVVVDGKKNNIMAVEY